MAPEVRIHAPPLSWKEGSNAPDTPAPVQMCNIMPKHATRTLDMKMGELSDQGRRRGWKDGRVQVVVN